jgi:hypothetical protein
MKAFVALFALLSSVPALATQVECRNSTGSIEYRYSAYRGGARPMRRTVLSTTQWIVKGEVVGEQIVRYHAETFRYGVFGELDESTREVTSSRTEGYVIHTRYRIRATLQAESGRVKTVQLSCRETQDRFPRP